MTAPMTKADALEVYRKAKSAHLFGEIHDLYVEAFRNAVVPEFCDESVLAIVILGDWLIEATMALEQLTEVQKELEVALHGKVEMFRQIRSAAPDTVPVDWDSAPTEAQLPDLVEHVTADEVFPDGAAPPAPSGDFGVRWTGTAEQFAANSEAIIKSFAREVSEVVRGSESHAERDSDPET